MSEDQCASKVVWHSRPRLWFGNKTEVGRLEFKLQMFGDARNLPAIVFAVEFVGKEVKLGLQ